MVPGDQNPYKRYFAQAGHAMSSTFAVLVISAAATVMLRLAKSQLPCTNSQLSVLVCAVQYDGVVVINSGICLAE